MWCLLVDDAGQVVKRVLQALLGQLLGNCAQPPQPLEPAGSAPGRWSASGGGGRGWQAGLLAAFWRLGSKEGAAGARAADHQQGGCTPLQALLLRPNSLDGLLQCVAAAPLAHRLDQDVRLKAALGNLKGCDGMDGKCMLGDIVCLVAKRCKRQRPSTRPPLAGAAWASRRLDQGLRSGDIQP